MNRQKFSPDRRQPTHGDGESRWVCVATAPDQLLAEMWQQLLRAASIPSMLAPQDTISFLGVTPAPVRLMVPVEMGARAEEALIDLAGAGDTNSEPEESR